MSDMLVEVDDNSIRAHQSEIEKLRADMNARKVEITRIINDHFERLGYTPGAVVISRGKRFRIVRAPAPPFVKGLPAAPSMLVCNPTKKDGTFGKADRRIYASLHGFELEASP